MWLYAAHRADLRAGAAWYGRLEGESAEAHPRHREAADRPTPFRTRKIKLPDLGDEARNAKLDRLVPLGSMDQGS